MHCAHNEVLPRELPFPFFRHTFTPSNRKLVELHITVHWFPNNCILYTWYVNDFNMINNSDSKSLVTRARRAVFTLEMWLVLIWNVSIITQWVQLGDLDMNEWTFQSKWLNWGRKKNKSYQFRINQSDIMAKSPNQFTEPMMEVTINRSVNRMQCPEMWNQPKNVSTECWLFIVHYFIELCTESTEHIEPTYLTSILMPYTVDLAAQSVKIYGNDFMGLWVCYVRIWKSIEIY